MKTPYWCSNMTVGNSKSVFQMKHTNEQKNCKTEIIKQSLMPDEDRENIGGFLVFEKPTYCSKSVVEKRRFRDRLVPTVGSPYLRNKAAFSHFPGVFRGPKFLIRLVLCSGN